VFPYSKLTHQTLQAPNLKSHCVIEQKKKKLASKPDPSFFFLFFLPNNLFPTFFSFKAFGNKFVRAPVLKIIPSNFART